MTFPTEGLDLLPGPISEGVPVDFESSPLPGEGGLGGQDVTKGSEGVLARKARGNQQKEGLFVQCPRVSPQT